MNRRRNRHGFSSLSKTPYGGFPQYASNRIIQDVELKRKNSSPDPCLITQFNRLNDKDNRARAKAPSSGRRTQLHALRLIRLFGRALRIETYTAQSLRRMKRRQRQLGPTQPARLSRHS